MERSTAKLPSTPPRCSYCLQYHTGGVSCNSVSGVDWVGKNTTGGAKPPKKDSKTK